MRAKPFISGSLLAGVLTLSVPALALGLGKLTVNSGLGQPLSAQIELTAAQRDELDSLRARIADPSVYRDNGAQYVGALARARITVEQQIARNLTITYVSNVSSTQQQVIQVEYNVDRNVSIVGLRDQNGTFGIDIKIKKRFP